jgi:hypothetical protein
MLVIVVKERVNVPGRPNGAMAAVKGTGKCWPALDKPGARLPLLSCYKAKQTLLMPACYYLLRVLLLSG